MPIFRKAILGVLLTLYILALSSAVFRISYRIRHQGRWLDDYLSGVSAFAGFVLFTLLFSLIVTEPILKPIHYNINICMFLFVLWISRSCFAMTTGRVYIKHTKNGSRFKPQFLWLSGMLFTFGVVFSTASIAVCLQDQTCNSLKDCFCRLPRTFSVIALISDAIADLGLVGINMYMLFNAYKLSGFASFSWRTISLLSSVYTFASSSTFWSLYILRTPKNIFLFICLSNLTVIISMVVSNIPIFTGAVARRVFPDNLQPPMPMLSLEFVAPSPNNDTIPLPPDTPTLPTVVDPALNLDNK